MEQDILAESEIQKKKKKGCFFWGLIGCGGLILVVVISVGAMVFFVRSKFVKYSSNEPIQIEQVSFSSNEEKNIKEKIGELKSISQKGGEFVLTDRDLNLLIASNHQFKNRAYVDFKNDKINIKFSLPFMNRYINGDLSGKLNMKDGLLKLEIDRCNVMGFKTPSKELRDKIASSLVEGLENNPEFRKIERRIEHIYLKNQKLHIKFKPVQGT
ncbi:hypothetical protein KAW08_04985 [bacterium]|nr:hypothetical protein [bacterium]